MEPAGEPFGIKGPSGIRDLDLRYFSPELNDQLVQRDFFVGGDDAIHDPFGSLVADEVSEQQLRRAVRLRVREFQQAEQLDLGVTSGLPDCHD